jgi:hypothetical protein
VGDAVYLWGIGLPLIPSAGNRAAIAAEGEGASNLTTAYDGGPRARTMLFTNFSAEPKLIYPEHKNTTLHRTGAVRTSENTQLTNFRELRKAEVQLLRIYLLRTRVNKGLRYGTCASLGVASGRNHSETWAGCIVSLTTPTSSPPKASRSVSSRSLAEKASRVFLASYFLL